MMNDHEYDCYKKAGQIAAEARDYGVTLLKPGALYTDIANTVEDRIIKKGAGIAFPVNIAVNELAAHYTPFEGDTSKIEKGDLVKLDVGAHVQGYIADTAVTIEIGTQKQQPLIEAARQALENAIAEVKEGVSLSHIGQTIEQTITTKGYHPIDNLTGHSLEQYNLHSGISVPNIGSSLGGGSIPADTVIAIEPFATPGVGHVSSSGGSNIYRIGGGMRSRLVRDQRSRHQLAQMTKQFRTLPFAQRWCASQFSSVDRTLKRLTMIGAVKHYPQLIEKTKGLVAQAEHTVIVTPDGCEVTT